MNLLGNPFDFVLAFLAGMGMSLTPCVYPLIPVTIGYIGINAAGSKLKGMALSFIYVTGIAVTYSLLGVLASLTGRFFGCIASHPLTYIFVGGIVVFFGLSMLDLFLFSFHSIKLPAHKKESYLSTFILGLSSGLIVGPCLTPALGAILTYIATRQNILYGVLLLVSFSYGMGFILILCGTFSSLLVSLPRSGIWITHLKKIAAVIILLMGMYFIFVGIGRLANWMAFASESAPDFKLSTLDNQTVILSNYQGNKKVLLVFWTTWCPSCRDQLGILNDKHQELIEENIEVLAINSGEPVNRVKRFFANEKISYKVLLDEDNTVGWLYGIIGVPTYVLVDKAGEIIFKDNFFPDDRQKQHR